MAEMFYDAWSFNEDISNWDTSEVETMRGMFYKAGRFNRSIDSWNTSSVVDISRLFWGATFYNQPLDKWDTSRVTNMRGVFQYAYSFNRPIGSWKTSAVRSMAYMFMKAVSFNQPIDTWDTSSVINMKAMFYMAEDFIQPLASWNTSSVVDMGYMFVEDPKFDQPIGTWDTSRVRYMHYMFYGATSFNQPLGAWDTSSLQDMSTMFYGAQAFNQPLSTWNLTSLQGDDAVKDAFMDSGLTRCTLQSFANAPGLSSSIRKLYDADEMRFRACGTCDVLGACKDTSLACVSQFWCRPVNSGFIEMREQIGEGRAWDLKNSFRSKSAGFRQCAAECEGLLNCTSFLLDSERHCFLRFRETLPDELQAVGVPESHKPVAFLKSSCKYFSCPSWATLLPSSSWQIGGDVTAASCCSCGPARIQDMSQAPELGCQVCEGGTVPASNGQECEACFPGFFALPGSAKCEACGPGSTPNQNQSACDECPSGRYALGGEEVCQACRFPFILSNNTACIWWHLPIIVALLLALSCSIVFSMKAVRKWQQRKITVREEEIDALLRQLEEELWHEKAACTLLGRPVLCKADPTA